MRTTNHYNAIYTYGIPNHTALRMIWSNEFSSYTGPFPKGTELISIKPIIEYAGMNFRGLDYEIACRLFNAGYSSNAPYCELI